jgi:hypothetical protein
VSQLGRLVLVLAALALAVAACSGNGSSAAERRHNDLQSRVPGSDRVEAVCDLLDRATIKKVVQVAVVETRPGVDEEGVFACSWVTAEGAIAVDIVYSEFAGDLMSNMRAIPGAEEIAGPGDAATFLPTPAMFAVQVDQIGFTVALGSAGTQALMMNPSAGATTLDPAHARRVLVRLAEAVVEKIGE